MGAVFASAARAPLTSLASVVEMTGDFALTLPVMLAVAIASTVSRAISYGTIYTTKLLRRGTDIDQAAPWRALADLKVADVMRPFRHPLAVPPQAAPDTDGTGAPDLHAVAEPVTSQHDPQSLFATESLAQTLHQLEVYGRDGLPVLSADGHQVQGLVTGTGVLQALARQITTAQTQSAADWDHADPDSPLRHPPAPLPGYQVIEITITGDSPGAGQKLKDVAWPPGSIPRVGPARTPAPPAQPGQHAGRRRARQPADPGARRLVTAAPRQARQRTCGQGREQQSWVKITAGNDCYS
jgi:chloride channel protein, CIC family